LLTASAPDSADADGRSVDGDRDLLLAPPELTTWVAAGRLTLTAWVALGTAVWVVGTTGAGSRGSPTLTTVGLKDGTVGWLTGNVVGVGAAAASSDVGCGDDDDAGC